MSKLAIAALAWCGLGLHLLVGVLALRSAGPRQLVPAVNLLTAACVIAYWGQRWYGYLFRGITWYASDQVLPLYAILVCVLAAATLTGRFTAVTLNWIAFAVHAAVFVAAVLFVSLFRMKMF